MASAPLSQALNRAVMDVVEFVHAEGWDCPPTLCALVPTSLVEEVLDEEQLDDAPLAAVVQQLPEQLQPGTQELGDYIQRIVWPEQVLGCVLAQEIMFASPDDEDDVRPARLFSGVLASGEELTLVQPRPTDEELEELGPFGQDNIELRGGDGIGRPVIEALLYSLRDRDGE
ncbi:PPA1309 family protein [Corynebacterium aquilae]|uniref:Uncharacterized protein n=1 Tax=Corynebacterium aquilae DSM 44791 TaxID=1431546 RepID=A0A1L7CEB2_9CORY|nr:PPA1309 family protein [Corynebacterium aquilae]APT84220.1 hypothetical protein CAQU_03070 [Corynebacterium aquilae DSM 44791]